MKHKLIAGILTIVCILSLLAGCANAPSEAPANAAASGDPADVADAASSGDQTLKVWCWDPAYNINAMNVAAEIYRQDHPDFVLQVEEISSEDIYSKLATSTSAGNTADVLPDIILFDDMLIKQTLLSYPDVFADLTDYGFDYSQFPVGKVAYSTVDGRNYGIPFDSGAAIAAYRTDVLAEAGYSIEDFTDITWSEFIEKAKIVLEKTGKPLLNGLSAYNQLDVMLTSCGGGYFDEEGNLNLTDNEKLRRCCEIYIEMVQAGVYQEEVGWDTYIGNMNSGTVAGAMNGAWIMSSIQSAEDQSGLWAITNVPSVDGVDGATNYSSQGGSTWTITTECDNIALAMDFFSKTFGGSTELHDRILSAGVLATWLPAADSEEYLVPVDYYGGQAVYSMITHFSANVPACPIGAYQSSARSACVNAIVNVMYSGADLDAELAAAEDTVAFEMGQ